MDGKLFSRIHWSHFVHRFADDVENSSEDLTAHGSGNWLSRVLGLHASHHTLCRFHGNRTDRIFTEVLRHLEHDLKGMRSSCSGNIFLEATDNIALSQVATTGNVTVSADDADYVVADGVGAITDIKTGDGNGNENISGNVVTLNAATGIGDAEDIDTAATSLSAVNSTSGAIKIFESAAGGALTITNAAISCTVSAS